MVGMCAGLLGFPRKGIGARNGESVSRSKCSSGSQRTTSRKSSAFLKVTIPLMPRYHPISTRILAISIDSPFSHLRSLLSSRYEGGLANLKFPLVSDLTQKITKDYKFLTDDGMSFPGVVVIDKEGVIQYYTVNNLLCGRSIDEILRILESIQYLKEHPGQACPVDWKYGDKTIYSHPLKAKLYFKELYSTQKN